ncbi:transporter substrate-binding domain-containing protein, partial [Avibacterium endocarditidis]
MKKTFKKITALFATTLLAVSLTACNDNESNSAQNRLQQLQKADSVRIGVFSDKPPFGYVDNQGKSQGFDVEIAKAIAKDLLGDENKVQYVLVEAANRVEYLQSNKVDIILANFTV